ncbi:transmembrane protein FAM155A [Sinocyclocheilus rhinocerous]|uniref:Transmembrane protein FAM155A-like n=1 Tax=Sinocyclocheilus rhinocerous TaxID=307959 RepID=A0A673H1B0_9TELE|nr:PREDICTED: transmembrane protein FAM155A-like [Sinocyclocheilus rhinocerous]
MTSGAWKCRQRDDGLKIWCAPRENEKPFTDSERAQRWRLSLASLLFLTVLLSDHLWFCAEAKLTRTRDKLASVDMSANHRPDLPSTHSSLRRNEDAIFVVNSTKPLWQLETCQPDGLSENCFTFVDADHLCKGLSQTEGTRWMNISDLYLSFCNSYSLMDLLYGSLSPDNLNCSLNVIVDGDLNRCSLCVQAYQRYDLHALEKYEEFEMMADKYETDVYSVRTCMEECKIVYKPWLCAQYFQSPQSGCSHKIPCEQYCLEVQQRCPFILPDNDDLIHGGTPSFICAGFKPDINQEPECCDVRWDQKSNNRSRSTLKRTHPSCQHTSVTSSGAPRLGQGRLKLCLLVLVLLHTVATMTANQNSTCLTAIFPLDDNAPREE